MKEAINGKSYILFNQFVGFQTYKTVGAFVIMDYSIKRTETEKCIIQKLFELNHQMNMQTNILAFISSSSASSIDYI